MTHRLVAPSTRVRASARQLLPILALATLATRSLQADHPTAAFGDGTGGPIQTFSAGTLPEGQGVLSLRFEMLDLDRLSDGDFQRFAAQGIDHAHSVDATSAVYLSAAYGVTDDLTIAARIPYVFRDDLRSSHIHDGAVEISQDGDSAGHGDLLVLAMYRVIALGEEGVDASVIAGIEMPTGFTTDRSRSGRVFHVEHQPGSGSWDPLVGIALSRPMGPVSIHASAVYTIATEGARETDLGDMLRYGLAVVWRVGGASHHHHDEDENGVEPHRHDGLVWDLILELEGQWQDKAEIAGRDDENSGGYELFLSPGVRLNVNERWSVYGAVGVPVYQDKNGAGHETDFRVIAGVAVSL